MQIISFTVDKIPEHYFKAELLLFSLHKFAKHPKEHILVQCVTGVDEKFKSFLRLKGYRYCVIEPYLDKKFCNKIPQIDNLISEKCDGVFLLDIDMFVLEPLMISDKDSFWAKIVDFPNPPMRTFKKIFKKAGISLPALVNTDFIVDHEKTIATNFNGGFYYIPYHYLAILNRLWKKWADWIYLRPKLFRKKYHRDHIDQISMALSVAESDITYKTLPSNYNFPIHENIKPNFFLPKEKIYALHYHWLISPFGMIDETKVTVKEAVEAIRRANTAISRQQHFEFFASYKRACIPGPKKTNACLRFTKALTKLIGPRNRRYKLILHAGTSKTGTTSLQFFMDRQRNALLKEGILYPKHYIDTYAPKHQWLIPHLVNANTRGFLKDFKIVISGVENNTHTIFLSTEGIFNHWWDFPRESKALLAELTNSFDVFLWVWFREPLSFVKSLYGQYMKNPRIKGVKCYGKSLSLEEILKDDWFAQHLDYLGFLYECEMLFGSNNVETFVYDGDIIMATCKKLGFSCPENRNNFRENISLSAAAVDILKIINRYPLSNEEKDNALLHVNSLNEILRNHSAETIVNEEARKKVGEMTALVQYELKQNGSTT
jgi:hypothetical protein